MLRYLSLIITLPLTVFAVLFALSNDATAEVALWPLEGVRIVPLYLLGLGMLALGFFCGAVFVSLYAQRIRFKYWQEKRQRARLEKEVEALQARLPAAAPAQAPLPVASVSEPMLTLPR